MRTGRSSRSTACFSTLSSTPEKFEAFYKDEVAKWAKVIQATGMPIQ